LVDRSGCRYRSLAHLQLHALSRIAANIAKLPELLRRLPFRLVIDQHQYAEHGCELCRTEHDVDRFKCVAVPHQTLSNQPQLF
jgi:hypothetical protein